MKNSKKPESPNLSSKILNSENLEKVSGGFIHKNNDNATHKWEVIDDYSGDVLGSYQSESEAKNKAPQLEGSKFKGQTGTKISNRKLEKLREERRGRRYR